MADYTKKIFEMLGVEPEEEFKLGRGHSLNYFFDKELKLRVVNRSGAKLISIDYTLQDILTGKIKIVKIPRPTAEEQIAIDYARACGCKWIAKNKNNIVFAFEGKPIKGIEYWILTNAKVIPIGVPISFIHWEDEEPFYIED